ncbi:MAG: helix-turn-helix domain-containing protein [Chloroflexota bacterium]|jgi:DNA-binding transcriptional ArsR family regulator
MGSEDLEVVIHPVRLRILQSLETGPKTTQQIANRLTDVPKSSLYRHLKLLLRSEFVTVSKIRVVQGIQEKIYQLNRPARLGPEAVAGVSADEHLRYFTTYLMVLLRGFSNYLSSSPEPNFVEDRAGYSEVSFWASRDELDELAKKINEALLPLLQQESDQGRRRHRMAFITYPDRDKETE